MRKFIILIFCIYGLHTNAQVDGVGINTTEPKSTLDINGNLSVKHVELIGSSTPTLIEDGVYISVRPNSDDQNFQLPDPRLFPGRIYIIRNIADAVNADITMANSVTDDGVSFFAGDSTTGFAGPVNMDSTMGSGNTDKTLIFISDGSNWTYGMLGF